MKQRCGHPRAKTYKTYKCSRRQFAGDPPGTNRFKEKLMRQRQLEAGRAQVIKLQKVLAWLLFAGFVFVVYMMLRG